MGTSRCLLVKVTLPFLHFITELRNCETKLIISHFFLVPILWNKFEISSDGKFFPFLYSYRQVLKRRMMMWEEIFIVRSTDGIHVHPCWLWKNDKRICFKAKGRSAAIQKQIFSTGKKGGRAMLQKNSPEFLLNYSVLAWHKIVKRFHKKGKRNVNKQAPVSNSHAPHLSTYCQQQCQSTY